MRLTEYFEMDCVCGFRHHKSVQDRNFTCGCGRKSLIDWKGVGNDELYRKLNGAQLVSDSLVAEIENRRQKVA